MATKPLTPGEKWGETEVQYPKFQAKMWQHDETGRYVVVEEEPGPPDSHQTGWYVAVLPVNTQDDPEVLGRIEDGLEDAEQAIAEAEAIMAAGKVDDYI